jgi:ABC-type histidine transport system ATPase subunit
MERHYQGMKRSQEFEAFTNLVDRVLAVPHSVIQERVEEARKQASKNPRKRGPKPKTSLASSRASGVRKRRVA